MTQTSTIAAAVLFAYLVYTTANGQLPRLMQIMGLR